MEPMNKLPKQRSQGQAIKFGSVNLCNLHLARAKHTPISRTGQSTKGRVKFHCHHHKHT
jgi:hypothetical protein